MIGYYDSIRSIPGYNGTTPIIDSESGYVSESGSGLGRQTQADYLQRTMLVNFSQGIPLSDWFNAVDISYYDWTFGLFEENGGYGGPWGKPKPTFYAMKTLTSSLQGTKYNRKLPDSNTDHWLTVFRSTTTDRETLAAWTTGNAGTTAVSGWGSYYLNGTPLYVGQSQARAGGDGKWSDNLWGTGSAWVNGSQATFNSSNATITVDGSPTISAIQFGAGNITLSGGALQFTSGGGAIHTQTGTGTINSVIAGGGDPSTFQLRKSGSGTLILGGANTFAGGVIVGQGAIQLGNANALRNNTVTVNATNGLKFSTGIGTFTLGGLAGSSSIALKDTGNTAVALQVGYNNLDSEYSGSLSGVGSLKKIGSGLLTLSGHNNYAGGTTISAGSLRFNSGSTFYKSSPRGANNITIESAGTLLADGDYTSAQAWLGSGKINTTSTGTLALTADSSDAISMGSYAGLSIGASGDYTYSGAMTPATDNKYRFGGGGGTLTVSSGLGDGSISRSLAVNGNVMLSGANSYTGGTTVNRGNLQFAAGSCPSSGSITIKSGGALVANGAYDNAQAWLDSGKIDAANSDGALAIAADTSTVNMTGYNNLSIGSAVAYTINSTITPAGNVFRLGGGGGTLTVSSILRNQSVSPYATRSLVTNGNVALTGVNTYSGVTTVNSGGKLTLNSGGSINNTSGITLQASGTLIQNSWRALGRPITFNGGTFGGTGQFNGNLTVGNGHLSPGDGGVGTLTIAGNVSLGSSSVLDYDFGITAGSCDRVSIIGGSLVLDGTLNVTSDLLTEGAYTIISGASSIIDNGLSFGAVPSDRDWSYSIANDGGVYSVIVMATPEPGTVVLLTTALLSVAAYAWRKRRCGN
jgi:autotransporter-associated beta strand protein